MQVPFKEIFHLEVFIVKKKKFIKINGPITIGGSRPRIIKGEINASRWPGKRKFVYFPPETLVRRKEPDTYIGFAD